MLDYLKKHSQLIEIHPTHNILLSNNYYQMKLRGTNSKMYLREAVWNILQLAAEKLPPHLGFYLFDTYRTVETQKHLFEYMLNEIKIKHPELTEEEQLAKTRQFVSDPFDQKRLPLLSHPSGGSVDLTLYHRDTGSVVDMGTGFDDPSAESATLFFTPPSPFYVSRQILYQTMLSAGFTNYSQEWWHYDLGNYSWAKKNHVDWYYTTI